MAIPWHPAAEIEGWVQGRLEQPVTAQQFLMTWVRLPLVSCQDVGSDNSDLGLPKRIVFLELVGRSTPTSSAKGFSRQARKGQTKRAKKRALGLLLLFD